MKNVINYKTRDGRSAEAFIREGFGYVGYIDGQGLMSWNEHGKAMFTMGRKIHALDLMIEDKEDD